MVSSHPSTDVLLWLRLAAAVAAVLLVPGLLLVGLHLRRADLLTRLVLSLAAGLLLVAALAAGFADLGLPFGPATALPVLVLIALAGWIRPGYGARVRGLLDCEGTSPAWSVGALGAICAGVLIGLSLGFSGQPSPPHLFDASNHAYMISRIVEQSSVDLERIFGPPHGAPPLSYLVGWHAAVALVAQVGGIEPFQAMWLLVLWMVALLPAALAVLWRAWRLPAAAVPVAAAVVGIGHYVPLGILGWGGFGVLLATFIVPGLTVGLTRWMVAPGAGSGLLLGLALGALLQIHGSEGPLVVGLAAATLWHRGDRPARAAWSLTPTILVGGLVTGHAFLTGIVLPYLEHQSGHRESLRPVGKALEEALHAAGRWELVRGLWPLSLLVGLRRQTRRLAVVALGVVAVAVLVGAVGDPVSGLLAAPFYREMPRILYLLVFFMGPLIAWGALALVRRSPRLVAWPRWVWGLATLGLLVAPAQPELLRLYRSMHRSAPFSAEDVVMARNLAQHVPPDAWVANVHNDGSVWAMHIADRTFLIPCQWSLGDRTARLSAVLGLLETPWPPETVALGGQGVDFAYARRTRVPDPRVDPRVNAFSVVDLDADPRFEPILTCGTSSLYRIRWDAGR